MAEPINSQPAQVQQTVLDNALQPEARRELSTATYSANANVTIDIPRDTSVRRVNLSASLYFTVTYAAGSPVLSPLGALAKVCPSVIVNADGSRNIKVIDLFMQRCMNAIAYSGFGRRAYRTGANPLTNRNPATEWLAGTIAYPATTQDVVIRESIEIYFENPWAYDRGKQVSYLYTRNLATCSLIFGFANVSSVLEDGNGATVTYSNVDIQIVPTIIEDRGALIGNGSFDFTETVVRKQFSSQATSQNIDLNTGNKMLGLGLMVRNGDTNKSLSDIAVTDLNLVINGSTSIVKTNFRRLSDMNKSRYGISDDQFASSVRALQGFAHMNLMSSGDLFSGIDTRLTSGVSQLQLQVSTASATGNDPATYTNAVELSILQQQLIPVPQKA